MSTCTNCKGKFTIHIYRIQQAAKYKDRSMGTTEKYLPPSIGPDQTMISTILAFDILVHKADKNEQHS